MLGIDKKKFGLRLREARKTHGMTQADLGECAGLGDKYISRIENGKAEISLDCFVRLVNAFDENPDYFLQDSLYYDYKIEDGDEDRYITVQKFGVDRTEQLLAILDKMIAIMNEK